ncbi:MAG: adenylate kinase [Cyanobacteria bacterium P01_H01_bin.15]
MNNPVHLIFLGPPGSGKGTQAEHLTNQLSFEHISTGVILRTAIDDNSPLGLKARYFVDRGELVPDSLLVDLIRKRLKEIQIAGVGWILDGFPRNIEQAHFLENLLEELSISGVKVIYLNVPDEELTKRLLDRGRKDDNESTVSRRLEVYREQTSPLIDFYQDTHRLLEVDGNTTPELVTATIKSLLAKHT